MSPERTAMTARPAAATAADAANHLPMLMIGSLSDASSFLMLDVPVFAVFCARSNPSLNAPILAIRSIVSVPRLRLAIAGRPQKIENGMDVGRLFRRRWFAVFVRHEIRDLGVRAV